VIPDAGHLRQRDVLQPSVHQRVRRVGLRVAIAAYQVSLTTFVSVWCFFAAVLSLLIYAHFSGPMQACRATLASSRDPVAKQYAAGQPST